LEHQCVTNLLVEYHHEKEGNKKRGTSSINIKRADDDEKRERSEKTLYSPTPPLFVIGAKSLTKATGSWAPAYTLL
jgi:hypothetical protein